MRIRAMPHPAQPGTAMPLMLAEAAQAAVTAAPFSGRRKRPYPRQSPGLDANLPVERVRPTTDLAAAVRDAHRYLQIIPEMTSPALMTRPIAAFTGAGVTSRDNKNSRASFASGHSRQKSATEPICALVEGLGSEVSFSMFRSRFFISVFWFSGIETAIAHFLPATRKRQSSQLRLLDSCNAKHADATFRFQSLHCLLYIFGV
jgi:hypothetical protein